MGKTSSGLVKKLPNRRDTRNSWMVIIMSAVKRLGESDTGLRCGCTAVHHGYSFSLYRMNIRNQHPILLATDMYPPPTISGYLSACAQDIMGLMIEVLDIGCPQPNLWTSVCALRIPANHNRHPALEDRRFSDRRFCTGRNRRTFEFPDGDGVVRNKFLPNRR